MICEQMSKKNGFTLAETLITLAIIGIVAALTMPTLMQAYKKRVVETRLAKFYSTINQEIKLSEIDNGPVEYWDVMYGRAGGTIMPEEWYNKYLKKYLHVLKVETTQNFERKVSIYFPDGSMCHFSGTSFIFYPNANDYEEVTTEDEEGEEAVNRDVQVSGTKNFTFMFYSAQGGVMPYGYRDPNNDHDENAIRNSTTIGCTKELPSKERALCTLWIMNNGWKIPDDYPLKF